MKRLFLAILVVAMLFGVVVNAEEVAIGTIDAEAVETIEELPEEAEETEMTSEEESEEESIYEALFNRLWEYIEENKTEVVGVLGDALLFVFAFFLKSAMSKTDKNTKLEINDIKDKVSRTLGGQNGVVGVVNNLIDSYNTLQKEYAALKESYDKYGELEDKRNRLVGALVAQNTALMEIITTVYANSKNLPQGVKDIVHIKYANCLKTLEDDQKLIDLVNSVRECISAPEAVETVETEE